MGLVVGQQQYGGEYVLSCRSNNRQNVEYDDASGVI